MPDTVTQLESWWWVVETAHIPPFSPGPSSPDSAVRPRRSPQILDEKELMAQLRQVREVGSVGAGRWLRHTLWGSPRGRKRRVGVPTDPDCHPFILLPPRSLSPDCSGPCLRTWGRFWPMGSSSVSWPTSCGPALCPSSTCPHLLWSVGSRGGK